MQDKRHVYYFSINKEKRKKLRLAAWLRNYKGLLIIDALFTVCALSWAAYRFWEYKQYNYYTDTDITAAGIILVMFIAILAVYVNLQNAEDVSLRTFEKLYIVGTRLIYEYGWPWDRIKETLDIETFEKSQRRYSDQMCRLYGTVRVCRGGHIEGRDSIYIPSYFKPPVPDRLKQQRRAVQSEPRKGTQNAGKRTQKNNKKS